MLPHSALLGLILLGAFLSPIQSQRGVSTTKIPEAELLVRFKKSNLFDVSSDGKLLLLYGVLTPKKGKFEKAVEWKAKSGDKMFDMLRVVEWSTGKEVASVHVHSAPTAASFLPDGGVCYKVNAETNDKKASYQNKFWDYAVNKTSICASEPGKEAYRGSYQKYESDDGQLVATTSKQEVRKFLLWTYVRGVISVERKDGKPVSVINHPTVREPLDWPLTGHVYSVAFDKESKHLISSYEGDTYVWKLPRPV